MGIQFRGRLPSWLKFEDLYTVHMELNPKKGMDSTAYELSRPSTATVVDHEGLIRTTKPGELRVERGRRVENLIPVSDAGITYFPIRGGVVHAPNPITGFQGSVYFPSTPGTTIYSYKSFAGVTNRVYALSCFVEMDDGSVPIPSASTGSGDFSLILNSTLASAYVVEHYAGNIYRISAYGTHTSGANYGVVRYSSQSNKPFRIAGIQIEDVTEQADKTASEYVSNGRGWLAQTSPENNGWLSVCWSPQLGLFCAVAASGTVDRVMTSPDGIAWTARASAANNDWTSVCWSPELGLFCAVASTGTGNRVMTSPDGITWTARASAANNDWTSVCWSPQLGLFCAVAASGTGNRVMTSPDGITWTARASAANNAWRSVCWSPQLGLFCAVASTGTGNRVMTSPDGITWTARASTANNAWYSVCWSPELGLFCAVAASGTVDRVMTSPDGITWTARASAANNAWYSVCWSPELGLFCAVAYTGAGNRVMTLSTSDYQFQTNGYHGYGVDGVKYFTTKKDKSILPVKPYILIEKQGTNLLPNSNTFSAWTTSNATVTLSTTVRDLTGGFARRITDTSSTSEHSIKNNVTLEPNKPYCYTFYAKPDTLSRILLQTTLPNGNVARATFNLVAQTISTEYCTATIQPVENGWYKCITYYPAVSGTASADSGLYLVDDSGQSSYTGQIKGLYVSTAQLEQSTYSSSYIPTTTTPVTRSADTLKYKFGAGKFPQEFCYILEYAPLIDGSVVSTAEDYVLFGTGDNGVNEIGTVGTALSSTYEYTPSGNGGTYVIPISEFVREVKIRHALQVEQQSNKVYKNSSKTYDATASTSGTHSSIGTLEIAHWAGRVMPMRIYRAMVTAPLREKSLKVL